MKNAVAPDDGHLPLDEAGSFAWIADPDERMLRASSAIVTSAGTLVIDPVDCGGLDDALSRLGPVAGIVQLPDRHNRDVVAVAARLSVPVLPPTVLPLRRGARNRVRVFRVGRVWEPRLHETADTATTK